MGLGLARATFKKKKRTDKMAHWLRHFVVSLTISLMIRIHIVDGEN